MGKGNKTHKATQKRFRKTATGKLVHKGQMDNAHMKTGKSNRTKRRQKQRGVVGSKNQEKKLKSLMS